MPIKLNLPKGTKRLIIDSTLIVELNVPKDWNEDDVLDFLDEHMSIRTAFQGLKNREGTAEIVDLGVDSDSEKIEFCK